MVSPSRLRTKHVLSLLVLLFVAASCGDPSSTVVYSPGGDPGDEDFEIGPEYYAPQGAPEVVPWVEFFEIPAGMDAHVQIDEESERVYLTNEVAQDLGEMKRGHVLFGDVHGGFGVQVADIASSADGMVVAYEPLELINIIHGEWSMDIEPLSLNSQEGDISTVEQGLSVNLVDLEAGPLKATGTVGVDVSPTFRWEGKIYANLAGNALVDTHPSVSRSDCGNVLHWSNSFTHSLQLCADYLHLSLGTTLTAEAKAELNASVGVERSVGRDLVNRPLGSIPVAGPIAVAPTVKIRAEASAGAEARAELEAFARGEVYIPIGIEWHHQRGVSPIGPSSGSLHFDYDASASAEVEARAALTLSATLTVGLTITGAQNHVGIGGLGAGVGVKAEARYNPFGAPSCLVGDVVLSPYVTGNLRAWGRLGPINASFTIVDDFHHPLGNFTLADWADNGRFCLGAQDDLVNQLNEEYSEDCDESPQADNCVQQMIEHCFSPPEDGCRGYVDPDFNILFSWPTGHRVETQRNPDTPTDFTYFYDADGSLCATSEFEGPRSGSSCIVHFDYVLEQTEEMENPGIPEHEWEESLEEAYETGALMEAGAEASICITAIPAAYSYTMAFMCPVADDDTTITVQANTQACTTGIGRCVFEAVDELPLD